MGKQLILQGEIVKKHNKIVRAPMRDINTNLEHKILACLIAQIRSDDIDLNQTYEIEVKTFLPPDGHSYQNVSRIADNMVRSRIEFKEGRKTHLLPIFRLISYGEGKIQAKFNNELQKYLIDLQRDFTQINLIEYLMLSSVYSQRLFELLKSWVNYSQKYVEISLSDLHNFLNTPESQRQNFKEFRLRVLEKAHKEINLKTNLFFDWEPIKKGNGKTSPVTGIHFNFDEKRRIKKAFKKALDTIQNKPKYTLDQQAISKENNKYGPKVHACEFYKKREEGEEPCPLRRLRTKKCGVCDRIFKERNSQSVKTPLFD